MTTQRLRFAPSPTGFLHLGGARTALFNWLHAQSVGGTFLLRVEDTDLARNTEESLVAILEGMAWLGMEPDEDYVLQSKRRDVHVETAQKMLAEGKAYKCFCTADELKEMRESAIESGRKNLYDRRWRDAKEEDHPTDGRPFTVRFKAPLEGQTTFDDMVLGQMTVNNEEEEDFIILRSDGTPTYNFVVVCDDAHMAVTHVVRGQDHVSNTFRQVQVYEALGLPVPTFGHLPLVDGLSKRKGSASVTAYREMGILPEAFINYIARLGWSHGDQEIFSVEELIEKFDLNNVNKGSSKYDLEKLHWVNSQWINRLETSELAARLLPYLETQGLDASSISEPQLHTLADALRPRSNTMVEMAEQASFAFNRPSEWDAKAVKKWMKAGSEPAYGALIEKLEGLEDFTPANAENAVKEICESFELKMGKLAQPVRVAMTGSSVSPGIGETLVAVGQQEAVQRLRNAAHLFDPEKR